MAPTTLEDIAQINRYLLPQPCATTSAEYAIEARLFELGVLEKALDRTGEICIQAIEAIRRLPKVFKVHGLVTVEELAPEAVPRLAALFGQRTQARKPKRKRRRASQRKPAPLTNKQIEAAHLVGEHKGNFVAAAKAAGKSRQAMTKLYDKALKKLGKKAVEIMAKTTRLPTDRRGQVNLVASSDEEE